LEQQTGHRIIITEDSHLEVVSAMTQMAWNYGREEHRILFRPSSRHITPHLLAHELVHITLEDEARHASRNRRFTSTAETRERAIRSVSDDIDKLRKRGLGEKEITNVILQLVMVSRTKSSICRSIW
jgi:hypothetical protein